MEFDSAEPKTIRTAATIDGTPVDLLPMAPNQAATNTLKFAGDYIGCGQGRERDYRGKSLAGRVAILEAGCDARWVRAFELGAVGVVFVANSPFSRVDAEASFLSVPARMPRFFLDSRGQTAAWRTKVLRSSGRIKIDLEQKWTRSKKQNRIGWVLGNGPAGKPSILIVVRDSMPSCVPDLPMDDGANRSIVVRLAQRVKEAELSYDIGFVVVQNSESALRGERELADRLESAQWKVAGVIAIDVGRRSRTFGLFTSGALYGARSESREVSRDMALGLKAAFAELPLGQAGAGTGYAVFDGVADSDGKPWKSIAGAAVACSSEPFALIGVPSVAIVSANDARLDAWVPPKFQLLSPLPMEEIERRDEWLLQGIVLALNQAGRPQQPQRRHISLAEAQVRRSSLIGGLATLEGRTVYHEPQKSLIADTTVPHTIVRVRGRAKILAGVHGDFVDLSDEEGKYRIVGLPQLNSLWYSDREPSTVDAFAANDLGEIEWSAASATSSGVVFPRRFDLVFDRKRLPIVMFRGRSITTYQAFDPGTGTVVDSLNWRDPTTQAPPRDADVLLPIGDKEPTVATSFLDASGAVEAVLRTGPMEFRHQDRLAGKPAWLDRAKIYVDANRAHRARLRRYRLDDPGLVALQRRAEESLSKASKLAEQKDWFGADLWSRKSLGDSERIGQWLGGMRPSSVASLLLLLALLMPAAVCVERLLFANRRIIARLLGSVAVFAAGYFSLWATHPAFLFIRQPAVVFVGFVMGALCVLVGRYLWDVFEHEVSHRDESPGLAHAGQWSTAYGLALVSLRRRPVRTALTLAVIAMGTFSSMALTSFVPGWEPVLQEPTLRSTGTAVRGPGFAPLSETASLFHPDEAFEERWKFAAGDSEGGTLLLESEAARWEARALVSRESPAGHPRRATVWLTEEQSKALGVAPGGEIRLLGMSMTVQQEDDPVRNVVDFGATPRVVLDDQYSETRSPSLLDQELVVRIDHESMLRLGGETRRLVLAESAPHMGHDLAKWTRNPVYVAEGGRSQRVRYGEVGKGVGWLESMFLLLVGGFFIFQSLMTSVVERKREIEVLGAIGLPPSGVSRLYFAEALVLGLLGSFAGFLLANLFARVSASQGLVPHLTFHFGGASTLMAFVATLATCSLAAWYPARLAQRDFQRNALEWNSDLGDVGQARVRCTTVAESRSGAALAMLVDWLEQHRSGAHGSFLSNDVVNANGSVSATIHPAPYELCVALAVEIRANPTDVPGVAAIDVFISPISGDPPSIRRTSRAWVEEVRGAFLVWQSSSPNVPVASATP